MATAKQLDDVTECPIFTEVYTDPRVLPCVHTYCLKCIEKWSNDKQPGDELVCPLCRKEFTVPSNGVADLAKNFFVNNLLQMKELSSVDSKTSPCAICSVIEGGESEVQIVASVYCVECQMKLCWKCEQGHKVIKSTRSHRLIEIGEKVSMETISKSMPSSFCDQHEDEVLKIYCFHCKMAICTMCFIKSHNGHKCSDINEVAGDFRNQMTGDVDNKSAGVEKCKEMLENVEKERNYFIEQVNKTRIEIDEKAEQLKQLIDAHREKLMNELSSIKQKRMKEIESLCEEIERQLLSMESYKKYVDDVRQKGTACDIARAASGLHDRADELLMFDVIERTLADIDVTFTSSNYIIDNVNETVGHLHPNVSKPAVKLSTPTLTHVIPSRGGHNVIAVTSLGETCLLLGRRVNKLKSTMP